MASCYDATLGWFSHTRLRTADASYLAGVDRPASLPEPIVYAQGPYLVGPHANAIAATEHWIAGARMPAMPDVVWVVVSADVILRRATGTEAATAIYLFPRGDVTNAAFIEGPQLGPLGDIASGTMASGGTNPVIDCPAKAQAGQGLWLPMDPAFTYVGWEVICRVTIGAGGGMLQDGAAIDLRGYRLIGYPVNVWDTGGLQAVQAFRGS